MRTRYPWNAIVAEAIGTFLFLFVGVGAGNLMALQTGSTDLLGVALAHGLALAVLVSAFAAISGGHLNPAVTFGLWLTTRVDTTRAIAFVIAQLIGAVAAAALVRYVFPPEVPSTAGVPTLNPQLDLVKGIVVEAVLTMVLVAAVFGTAVDPRAPKIGGLAIGFAVGADILMGGPLTGAAMNPARWFGPAVVAGDFTNAPVWIIGPLLGAAIVAIVYRYLFLPEAEEQTGVST